MSNKNLMDKLAGDLAETSPAAWRRYRELLSENVGDDQQVEELKKLMPLLHKTAADVVKDQATIAAAKALRVTINTGRDLEPAMVKATAAAEAKAEEVKKINQGLLNELATLRGENTRLHDLQLAARKACDDLAKLKQDHGDLLADVENFDPSKL